MATLNANPVTLLDWAKRRDPNGNTAMIVELLQQKNEILLDMAWREGNLPTGHRTTVRTGLPTVSWRLLNNGVAPSKSKTAQIDEQCGMLEAWSEVDVDLAKLNGDINSFRLSESGAFIEAMNQEMAQTLFYGNATTATEEFTGLSPRYSSLSGAMADNVISAAGSGSDNASIWLIGWNENTLCGIFPQGSTAGLQVFDYGEQTVIVSTGLGGTKMRAYQSRWQWKAGLCVKDWRYAVRICNIDVSDLAGGSAADLIDKMEQAEETLPDKLGKRVFYMNRKIRRYLRAQTRADVGTGGGLTYDNVDGQERLNFNGTPVAIVDALLNTEAAVS